MRKKLLSIAILIGLLAGSTLTSMAGGTENNDITTSELKGRIEVMDGGQTTIVIDADALRNRINNLNYAAGIGTGTGTTLNDKVLDEMKIIAEEMYYLGKDMSDVAAKFAEDEVNHTFWNKTGNAEALSYFEKIKNGKTPIASVDSNVFLTHARQISGNYSEYVKAASDYAVASRLKFESQAAPEVDSLDSWTSKEYSAGKRVKYNGVGYEALHNIDSKTSFSTSDGWVEIGGPRNKLILGELPKLAPVGTH